MRGFWSFDSTNFYVRLRLNRSKTFSAFSDVWGAVKPKSTENSRKLTGKSQRKIRKMVYGKFFVNHFPKHTCVSLSSLDSRLSLCFLSFSHWSFADLVTGLRSGLRDEAVERRGGLRDEASPIWGFATRLLQSGLRGGLCDEASRIWALRRGGLWVRWVCEVC